jgi:hypothetical protein
MSILKSGAPAMCVSYPPPAAGHLAGGFQERRAGADIAGGLRLAGLDPRDRACAERLAERRRARKLTLRRLGVGRLDLREARTMPTSCSTWLAVSAWCSSGEP